MGLTLLFEAISIVIPDKRRVYTMADNAACEKAILQTGMEYSFHCFCLTRGADEKNFVTFLNCLHAFLIDANAVALHIF